MQETFKDFYVNWYSRARKFAWHYLQDWDYAENVVQDVFIHIFERWTLFDGSISLTGYLFTSIKNNCLKVLQQKLKEKEIQKDLMNDYLDTQLKYDALKEFDIRFHDEQSIDELLHQAIDCLPERCREIFILHKLQGMKQKDISAKLGISENTIETQIRIAYRKLREELKNYFPLLLFLLV